MTHAPLPRWAAASGWQSHPVPGRLIAHLRPAPPTPSDLEPALAASWQRAQEARGGRLFDGQVFSADEITAEGLFGHFASYRAIIAQIDEPALYPRLRLRPLAVCGLVRSASGILLGRRAPHMGYQPGLWQLPPAGSVDPSGFAEGEADLVQHFWREIEEELGLGPADVATLRPCGLLEHPESHILDLFFLAETTLSGETLRARQAARGNDEYDRLEIVPETSLPAWIEAHRGELAPQTLIFLAFAGLGPLPEPPRSAAC
jgi:8-oxo-dGTP pyrophosphatase MutT (NUDIX family)